MKTTSSLTLTIMDRDGKVLYEGPMPQVHWSYEWGNEHKLWYLKNARRPRFGNKMRRKIMRAFKLNRRRA